MGYRSRSGRGHGGYRGCPGAKQNHRLAGTPRAPWIWKVSTGRACEGVFSSALYLRDGTWWDPHAGGYSYPGLGFPEGLGEILRV